MRAIHINYIQRPASRWPGMALLAVAAAAAVLVSYHYLSVTRSLADAEIALSRLERRVVRGQDAPIPLQGMSAGDNTALQRAGELVRRLSLPWDKLFQALESLRHDNVALLSVEPDTTTGTVRILAEAKDATIMMEYMDEVRDSGLLNDVVLSNHQVVQQNPYKPVRFAFAGTWTVKR